MYAFQFIIPYFANYFQTKLCVQSVNSHNATSLVSVIDEERLRIQYAGVLCRGDKDKLTYVPQSEGVPVLN
jgi:hypothetical protein